jgi:nucleoside-triphosphatase THEP1
VLRQRLEAAAAEVEQLKQTCAVANRQLIAVSEREYDVKWVARVLSNFHAVWTAMTPINRGRMMRGLVEKIVVDEASGKVVIHFNDFERESDETTGSEAA